jgi:cell division septum initiation protein DivIVA
LFITNQELLQENAVLKKRILELELSEATLKRVEAALRDNEHYLNSITHAASGENVVIAKKVESLVKERNHI